MSAFTLVENDKGDVVGQRRTGKKWTVFKAEDVSHVYKGPYKDDEKRFIMAVDRSNAFVEWETPCIVPIVDVIEGDAIVPGTPVPVFNVLVFENILERLPSHEPDIYTERKGDYSYYVNNDSELSKLSRVFGPDKLTSDLLLGMLHAFILNTGDTGPQNILYSSRTKQMYIIDYEDSRTKDFIDAPIFFFNKAPAKKYDFSPWIAMYPEMIEIIENSDFTLPEDSEFEQSLIDERVRLTLKLLRRFSGTEPPKKIKVAARFKKTPRRITPKRLTPLRSTSSDETNRMNYVGMRGSITRHGFKYGVIRSALQKNIRRGELDQALACAYELYDFIHANGYDIVHNLLNRLSVISAEDSSPGNIALAAYVCGWNRLWTRDNKMDWVDDPELFRERKYDWSRIAAVVKMLVDATKSRLPSHLWNRYVREPHRPHNLEEVRDLDSIPEEETRIFLRKEDSPELVKAAKSIWKLLEERDPIVFTWVGNFLENFVEKKVQIKSREGRRRADIILWLIFGSFVEEEYLYPLRSIYYTLAQDKRAVLQYVMTYILYKNDDAEEILVSDIAHECDTLTKKFRTEGYTPVPIVIADYMVDLHTGKRGNKKDLINAFRRQGSVVTNQDPDYYDPDLEELYMRGT